MRAEKIVVGDFSAQVFVVEGEQVEEFFCSELQLELPQDLAQLDGRAGAASSAVQRLDKRNRQQIDNRS